MSSGGSTSWRSLLIRISDKCPEYGGSSDDKEHIDTCFSALLREWENSKDDILELLLECAERLPHKIPFYGVLVGLINLENESFVKRVVDETDSRFQEALYSGNCNRIRILLRFLTVLMCNNVILPGSLVGIFETLLSSAATTVNEDVGNPSWQARADFYITCILSSLPWGGAELVEQVPDEFERVMVGMQSYLGIRNRSPDAGFAVFEVEEDKIPERKDFLEDLWDRMQVLASKGWKAESVPRPHLLFESQLVAGSSHALCPIICPEPPATSSPCSAVAVEKEKHEALLKYPQRLRRLNIFPSSKSENMQPVDRFVVEEYLLDVLFFFNGCRKECASFMASLRVPFRYEYLMAETIFSQQATADPFFKAATCQSNLKFSLSRLLLLPQAPFKPLYYALVIIDLCKALPGAFPAVVVAAVRALFDRIDDMDMECRTRLILWFSQHLPFCCGGIFAGRAFFLQWMALPGAFPAVVVAAVRALFDRIDDMDMECRTRLILWFSQHLSNFQYIWPWGEWAYVKDLPRWSPQRVFVQEVLEREIRLSYWDRIKQSVENAPELEELLPPKGGPNFRYCREDDRESTDGHALSAEFSSMVKARKGVQQLISWAEESIIPIHGYKVAAEVVIQTLLDIGSKSFTHLITVLERYGQVIAKLCPDHDNQILLIGEVSHYWKNNTQMIATTIDRMMGYRFISNLAIVNWVFSPSNVDLFHLSDRPWEILRNAINKTYNRISDLRKEIASLEKSISSAEETTVKAQKELEAAELKLELVDGQPVHTENSVRFKRLKGYAAKAKDEEISLRESLEAKEALFARAFEENKVLFLSLYRNFRDVLKERLPPVSADGKLPSLKDGKVDTMAVDGEEPPAMEVDNDNGKTNDTQVDGEKLIKRYNLGEQEQWCLTTLGHVKAFSRQYATEMWPHIEMLDAEVFAEDAHPLFCRAAYIGLGRSC